MDNNYDSNFSFFHKNNIIMLKQNISQKKKLKLKLIYYFCQWYFPVMKYY